MDGPVLYVAHRERAALEPDHEEKGLNPESKSLSQETRVKKHKSTQRICDAEQFK